MKSRRALLPWLWLGLMLVLFMLPGGQDTAPPPPGLDKLVHVGLFAVWIVLWRATSPISIWRMWLTALAIAVSTEVIQELFVPRRTGTWADLVADLIGVIIGSIMPKPARPSR